MSWKRVSVGSVSEVVTKGTTPTSIGFNFAKEGILFLRVNNIQNGKLISDDILFIDSETDKALARSRIQPRDVLISIAGTIGRTAVVPPSAPAMNCNQAVAIVRFREGVDPYYVNYWLGTDDALRQITGLKVTATISNLSLGCIKELKIPLPPLEEQRRIAAILDKADAVRRKRQEAIALTEELLRSAFLEMFGDPVTNPKGWETVNLGNLLAEPLQNGAYFPKERYVEDGTGTEMVHMSDAFYGTVKRGNLKQVILTPADIEKYGLNFTDVLIARRSLNYEGSAKPCLIPAVQEPLIFESSLIRVRLNRDILDSIFFFSYMLQPRARETYVFPHVTRSTISGINQAGLQRVQVLVPPLSIQKDYRRLYERVKSFGSSHEGNMELLDNLFNSLLQRAFLGEL